ncbi:M12 family metallopeptidase [Pedobacter gandavensis]|uniref:M12 family metallopeptidase n=1 Tax=Pedobacter gandavensis TaxID=2679963 RepID=UPI002478D3EF|nr:M12 family metallopeptidase [Pedobacter gandavensis]WGQ11708.1 M12 family metallopeptidase [Pedobacter gandavensis]
MKKYYSLFVLLAICLAACKKDTVIQHLEDIGSDRSKIYNLKNGGRVSVLINEAGEYVLGGDVILSANQIDFLEENSIGNVGNPSTKSTFTDEFQKLWPDGIVYYVINDINNSNSINYAMAHWAANTPIRFVQRSNQNNYVDFSGQPDQGAGDSQLGMVGGRQQIRLSSNIPASTVIHEIGHSIGLIHEQCRADRDNYINVNYSNINSIWKYQYDTYNVQGNLGNQLGPYDFNSIMGYPSFVPEASKNNNTTPQMTKKDGSTFFRGQWLSQGDIEGVNFLYKPIYIKTNWILDQTTVVDQSSGAFEQRREEHEMSLEFFSDKDFLNPIALSRPLKIKLRSNSASGYNGNIVNTGGVIYSIDVAAGQTGVYLGRAHLYYIMEYGTYTSYDESSISLIPGVGYK